MLFHLKLKKTKVKKVHSCTRIQHFDTALQRHVLYNSLANLNFLPGSSVFRVPTLHILCIHNRSAVKRIELSTVWTNNSIPGSKFGYHVGGGNKFPVRHQLNSRGKETPRLILEQISTGYRHNQKQFPGWMDGCPV
jgi:hypothetical protein